MTWPGQGIGVYVHVPFCLQKCHYCDFVSYSAVPGHMDDYYRSLLQEIELTAPEIANRPVTSLYVGGGTPTALPLPLLCDIIRRLLACCCHEEGPEVSVEVNPGTLHAADLARLQDAGVTRLSVGVQSFDDSLLCSLQRLHSAQEAVDCITAARTLGLSVNADLMFGIPGQTRSQFRDSLTQLVQLGPQHISCYSLIVEPTTPLAALVRTGQCTLPGEDEELSMYEEAIAVLNAAGYEHYEISNWARPGHYCRHNEIYWRNEWYRGLGPAAHSHWTRRRWANTADLVTYSKTLRRGQLPIIQSDELSLDDEMDETMMMGLRLLCGVSNERFQARFGESLPFVYGEEIERLSRQGLVEYDGTLKLTHQGLLLGNMVFAAFLRGT